jgi:hypothetical protein
MITKGKGVLLAFGLLGSILAGTAPAMAQSHSGGGHASSGGHFAGGGAHGGAVPGHSAVPAHYAGGAHYAGYAGGSRGYPAAYHGGYAGHGAYGYPGHYYGYGHGYSTGPYWRGAYWRGGYWGGGYWPRAYYGLGFAWFLPVLPLAYATYWYGGVPYYYANDVYYTYNPSYSGYVATDPPPAADSGAAGAAGGGPAAAGQYDSSAPNPGPGPGAGGAPGQIFMYPKNGQSPEQQATDKAECQKWASEQAGQVAQNGSDYQRAMVACVEGRGYSAN